MALRFAWEGMTAARVEDTGRRTAHIDRQRSVNAASRSCVAPSPCASAKRGGAPAATVKPMHEPDELPMSDELLRRLREAGM
jgi:hypothetical protein